MPTSEKPVNPYSEFRVTTPDGRNLIMSDNDENSLKRYLKHQNIAWTDIEPYTEYERDVEIHEAQEKLNHELEGDAA